MFDDIIYWVIVAIVIAVAGWLTLAVLIQILLRYGTKNDVDDLGTWAGFCLNEESDHSATWVMSEARQSYFYIIKSKSLAPNALIFALEQRHTQFGEVKKLCHAEYSRFSTFEIEDLKPLGIKNPLWGIDFGTDLEALTQFATRIIREVFKDDRRMVWYRTLRNW